MKYFLLLLLITSCTSAPTSDPASRIIDSVDVVEPVRTPVNLPEYTVGETYTICGGQIDKKDPFSKRGVHRVKVCAIKDGYVQYYELNDIGDRTKFSRSFEAFKELINDCK